MKKYILLAMVLMVAIASSATTVVKVRTKDSRKVMPFYADSVDNIFYDIYLNQHCLNFKMKNDNLEYFLVGDVIEVKHHIIDPTQESEEATVSCKIGDYDYVDLELPSGNLWATYNVGASKPLECGDYFAWAETSPKEVYNWNTLKYYDPSGIGELVKYNFDRNNGYVDNLEYLESIDDAAYVNWGEKWKTPYNSQQIEMVDGCTWKWVENFEESGLSGYLGTSKYNENTIFFPLAGRMENSSNSEKGVLGSYWSNSIKYENSLNGLILDFVRGADETEILIESKFIAFRDLGLSIRAVSE